MTYDKRDIVETYETPMIWIRDTRDTVQRLHKYRWYDSKLFVTTNNYVQGRNRPPGPHYQVPSTIVKY